MCATCTVVSETGEVVAGVGGEGVGGGAAHGDGPARRPGSDAMAHPPRRAQPRRMVAASGSDGVESSGEGRVTDAAPGGAEARPPSRASEVLMRRAVPRQVAPLHHARAAAMRATPTATEALLWEGLRGSRLGVGFRRQVPVGRHIVDFFAVSARLVVEVDGGYHAGRAAADARRDRDLARIGVRVLRVPASLVARSPEEALALVRAALAWG